MGADGDRIYTTYVLVNTSPNIVLAFKVSTNSPKKIKMVGSAASYGFIQPGKLHSLSSKDFLKIKFDLCHL